MDNHQRAAHLWDKAERLGLDAPSERMIADAIHDAEEDKATDFLAWLLSVDKKLAKRYQNELELKQLEDAT